MRPKHLTAFVELLRSRQLPSDQLQPLVAHELAELGIGPELVELWRDQNCVRDARPFVLVGTQLYGGSLPTVALGFMDYFKKIGTKGPMVLDTCARESALDFYVRDVLKGEVAGVVFASLHWNQEEFSQVARDFSSRRIPVVFALSGPERPVFGCGVVRMNGREAASLATDLLVRNGHTKIVALAVDGVSPGSEDRILGYETKMIEHGLEPRVFRCLDTDSALQPDSVSDRPVLQTAAEYLADDHSITAVVGLKSDSAKALYLAFRRNGRTLGGQVSAVTIGCRDWMHDIAAPPVSHIAIPFYEIGQRAARLIHQLRFGNPNHIEREVTVPLPANAIHNADGGTAGLCR